MEWIDRIESKFDNIKRTSSEWLFMTHQIGSSSKSELNRDMIKKIRKYYIGLHEYRSIIGILIIAFLIAATVYYFDSYNIPSQVHLDLLIVFVFL